MTGYKRVSEMTLEEKREKVAGFNVIDDVFFQKMMEDKEVCEEILRIILGDSKMRVIECVPQASIKNLNGKSVVLDVLCRDNDGKYCNVEVQKADDDDHQKRVRYNAALISMYTMQAGKDYKELPDVKVVFISRFDVFKADHAMYHVDRVVRETGQKVENGQSEIYVNAKVKDQTSVSELMEYFTDSNGRKEICPKLLNRVMMFKTEQKEVTEMCELMEKERLAGWKDGWKDGREEGKEEGREEGKQGERIRLIVSLVDKMGMSFEDACRFMEIAQEKIEEYRRKVKGNIN